MKGGAWWGELAAEWMERTGSQVYTLGERKQGLPISDIQKLQGKGSFTSFVLKSTKVWRREGC